MKTCRVLFFGLFVCFSLNALDVRVVNKNMATAFVKHTKKKFLRGLVDAWYVLPAVGSCKTFSLSDSQDIIMIEVGGRKILDEAFDQIKINPNAPLYKGATFWLHLLKKPKDVDKRKTEYFLNVRCLINNYIDRKATENKPYQAEIEQFEAGRLALTDFFDIPLENPLQEFVTLTISGRGSAGAYAEVKVSQSGKEVVYSIPQRGCSRR